MEIKMKLMHKSAQLACYWIALWSLVFPMLTQTAGSPDATGNYELDNAHTSVVFAINHFGLSYVYGRFNEVSGEFSLENGEITQDGFSFRISSKSIDTNHAERDEHLRSADFFDCQQFPEIVFNTIRVEPRENDFLIIGELKMLDQVRIIEMPMQLVGIGTDAFGKERAGFFSRFTLKRSDFGMTSMIGSIGDNVAITFSFEGVRKPKP